MQDASQFLTEWAAAERAGDAAALETLLSADFAGVGPLGFILPKHAWLARHRGRDLAYTDFSVDEVDMRSVGKDAALAIVRINTRGSYQGHPVPEATRATLALVSNGDRWKLAAIHMSFIAGTAGAPPMPSAIAQPAPGASEV